MKYSLWLTLPEPIHAQLQLVIDELATTHDAPSFEPHATLVSGIEREVSDIEVNMKELVNGFGPLELSLGPVSFSTTYFQSVLVRVNSTARLMDLNLKTKKMFNIENEMFMPHVSLLYGIDSMAKREEIASKIKLPAMNFTVNELLLTPATLDTKEWHHVATVEL